MIFTDPWMIARESKNPDEAWEFTKMLVDPKTAPRATWRPPASCRPRGAVAAVVRDIGKRMPWLAGDPLKQLIEGSMAKGYESANHLLVGFNQMETMVSAERQAIFLNKRPRPK